MVCRAIVYCNVLLNGTWIEFICAVVKHSPSTRKLSAQGNYLCSAAITLWQLSDGWLLNIAVIYAVLCKIYVTALKMKIYVKLLSLSLQKHLLKQKWIFHRNLMVVLICARRKAVETASCSCFVSALLLHETNFYLFQRGRFQTTRRKCQICWFCNIFSHYLLYSINSGIIIYKY